MIKRVIFLGTGPSSSLPNVHCITHKRDCKVCNDYVLNRDSKNVRGNISVLIQVLDEENREKNILLDCGKTFYNSTLNHFTKNNIKHIDAVIITHGHADAMFGLDDLRPWCDVMESKTIPVYLNQETMNVARSTFPYLVDTSKATGGGAVAKLDFNIINEYEPFSVFGVDITPLPVEHGLYSDKITPYMCFAYKIDDICFVSDTNKISDQSREYMLNCNILILDLLKEEPYASHFGMEQMLKECELIQPKSCYTVGMAHQLDHYELEKRFSQISLENLFNLYPAFDGLILNID
ncbi:Metallo-hydrolase/oxidoreductase [Neoconidiobolus thromboides FSU 785]|nr:Metallo-hydrolase/oxidoreductase [Neoconidiobolus thromboides FSU 785]